MSLLIFKKRNSEEGKEEDTYKEVIGEIICKFNTQSEESQILWWRKLLILKNINLAMLEIIKYKLSFIMI